LGRLRWPEILLDKEFCVLIQIRGDVTVEFCTGYLIKVASNNAEWSGQTLSNWGEEICERKPSAGEKANNVIFNNSRNQWTKLGF
jgi:hypothetical protein